MRALFEIFYENFVSLLNAKFQPVARAKELRAIKRASPFRESFGSAVRTSTAFHNALKQPRIYPDRALIPLHRKFAVLEPM